jgi:hypothetical protein
MMQELDSDAGLAHEIYYDWNQDFDIGRLDVFWSRRIFLVDCGADGMSHGGNRHLSSPEIIWVFLYDFE